jgi:hypothetical protein
MQCEQTVAIDLAQKMLNTAEHASDFRITRGPLVRFFVDLFSTIV